MPLAVKAQIKFNCAKHYYNSYTKSYWRKFNDCNKTSFKNYLNYVTMFFNVTFVLTLRTVNFNTGITAEIKEFS